MRTSLPAQFRPPVSGWFEASFACPTRAQALGWPPILSGRSTLLLAPTGSGKTLAAFLTSIDKLMFTPADFYYDESETTAVLTAQPDPENVPGAAVILPAGGPACPALDGTVSATDWPGVILAPRFNLARASRMAAGMLSTRGRGKCWRTRSIFGKGTEESSGDDAKGRLTISN